MNIESRRIADQLRRAFSGDPWHGSSLRDLLDGVNAEQAIARPLPSSHTIWELVLHIEIYVTVALEAVGGVPMPNLYGTEKDWPAAGSGASAWAAATTRMFERARDLAVAIDGFRDSRLPEMVPGRDYDFYYLFHGIVQHRLYHGGQIAMLKKAVA